MRCRHITIKIIPPESYENFAEKKVFRADPKHYFKDASVDEALEMATEYLDKKFPLWEFRCVKVGRMDFNFIFDGIRKREHGNTSYKGSIGD